MAQLNMQVIEEDRFWDVTQAVANGIHDTTRWAAHAVRKLSREIIVRDDAIITGDLWRSITVGTIDWGRASEVYSTVPYASFVHNGTDKMRPRPFFTEAIDTIAPQAVERLRDLIEGAAR